MFKYFSLILSNVLVAIITITFLILSLWSQNARNVIEASQGYPQNITIFEPKLEDGNIEINSQMIKLQKIEKTGKLGFYSAALSFMKELPKVKIGKSLIQLGLVQLEQGRLPKNTNEVLTQQDGSYRLGIIQELSSFVIKNVGFITSPWLFMTQSDVFVFNVVNLEQIRNNDIATFVFQSSDDAEIRYVGSMLQNTFGYKYTAKPLYEYIAGATLYMEAAQISLQRRMALFMLAIMLFLIYANINFAWFEKREELRIERMLGRDQKFFFQRWLIEGLTRWIYGILVAFGAAFAWSTLYDKNRTLLLIALWLLTILILGISLSYGLARKGLSVPLSRTNSQRHASWFDLLPMGLITTLLVASVPLLFTNALRLWRESSLTATSFGASSLMVRTTPAAQQIPTREICPETIRDSCAEFGYANADLWTPAMTLRENSNLQTLARFSPSDAAKLGFSLIAGRYPQKGKLEVTVNAALLDQIRAKVPSFGIGTLLNFGFRIVGVISAPNRDQFSVFSDANLYQAAIYMIPNKNFVPNNEFLSPSGKSGLLINIPQKDQKVLIRFLHNKIADIEILRPAEYAYQLASIVGSGLIRLLFLLILSTVMGTLVYWRYIQIILAHRALEISIWRTLGMNLKKIQIQLSKKLLINIFIFGFFGSSIGTFIMISIFSGSEMSSFIEGISLGLGYTIFLISVCFFIISKQIKMMSKLSTDTLYRRAQE